MNLIVWSFTLKLVLQACYEYHLTWAWVPHIVRKCQGISECLDSGHPVWVVTDFCTTPLFYTTCQRNFVECYPIFRICITVSLHLVWFTRRFSEKAFGKCLKFSGAADAAVCVTGKYKVSSGWNCFTTTTITCGSAVPSVSVVAMVNNTLSDTRYEHSHSAGSQDQSHGRSAPCLYQVSRLRNDLNCVEWDVKPCLTKLNFTRYLKD